MVLSLKMRSDWEEFILDVRKTICDKNDLSFFPESGLCRVVRRRLENFADCWLYPGSRAYPQRGSATSTSFARLTLYALVTENTKFIKVFKI